MKHRSWLIVGLLLALSMQLSGCASPAPAAPSEVGRTPGASQAAEADFDLDNAVSAFLANMQGYNVLRMRDLTEMLSQDPAPFLLDVRELSEVEASGHIPGAVVIPLRELAGHLDMLPASDQTVISYCGGGWRCTIAMTALGMLGWQQVLSLQDGSFGGYLESGNEVAPGLPAAAAPQAAAQPDPGLVVAIEVMLGGLPEGWGAITADDLANELDENPDLILLDARGQAEIDLKGAIEGENTLTIPIEEIVARRGEWPGDRDAPIVVYSGSGHRGSMAMTILRTYGYAQVRSLWGGLGAWVGAGYPVVGLASP